jgi:hypothetical protein
MTTYNEIIDALIKAICSRVPESSHLFWIGEKAFMSYFNEKGEWITKPAMRDPNYSGCRYVCEP